MKNFDINIDKGLKIKILPASTIIDDFVKGELDCKYEKYLLELLNISNDYAIDFKFLASRTRLQASILSSGITKYDCVTLHHCSKKTNGTIEAVQIHVAFRTRTLSDLINLKQKSVDDNSWKTETDVIKVLDILEKTKNILLFFPFEFSYDDENTNIDVTSLIRNPLNYDFKSLFDYRKKFAPDFDTYFLVVYEKNFCIFKVEECRLVLYDTISYDDVPTFKKLLKYSLY